MFAMLLRKIIGTAGPGNEGRRPSWKRVALAVEALEQRQLMVSGLTSLVPASITPRLDLSFAVHRPLQTPLLNSNAGAPHSLYLDFDGHFEPAWSSDGTSFTNVLTQVFDTDGNRNFFSTSEQALIREIWARVAEDFAPFNINVTTVAPASFANGVALRVAIGATNMPLTNSGYASINSFNDDQPNVVYVFADNILGYVNAFDSDGDGRPYDTAAAIATTASHEAGHAFGLEHQRVFDDTGKVVTTYNPGTPDWTPIMGDNLCSDRTTWSNGPTHVIQVGDYYRVVRPDEMQSLANLLGYRGDDVADSANAARPLSVSPGKLFQAPSFNASGLIGQMSDVDSFSFEVTQVGRVNINLHVAKFGPNLDSVLTLYQWRTFQWGANPGRRLVRIAQDSPAHLGAQINRILGRGSYVVAVSSTGEYGSVGQYLLSGSLPGQTIVVPPSEIVAIPAPVQAWPVASALIAASGGAAPRRDSVAPAPPASALRWTHTAALDRLFATAALQPAAELLTPAGVGLERRL